MLQCEKCGKMSHGFVHCPRYPGRRICTGCCMSCEELKGKDTTVPYCDYITPDKGVDTD